MSFRHSHGDTHEIRAFSDLLRRPRLEASFGILRRQRDRPSFNTPGLRRIDTNRRSGKSHTAFGMRHVDISLRTIFLPVTFFTTQSTWGSRHKELFQRVTIVFEGAPLPPLLLFPPSSPLLLPLLNVLLDVILLSFPLLRNVSSSLRTASVVERSLGAGIAITGQNPPRPRLP